VRCQVNDGRWVARLRKDRKCLSRRFSKIPRSSVVYNPKRQLNHYRRVCSSFGPVFDRSVLSTTHRSFSHKALTVE
jgi:hypothetical protein